MNSQLKVKSSPDSTPVPRPGLYTSLQDPVLSLNIFVGLQKEVPQAQQ
jgi:hypothetical protein